MNAISPTVSAMSTTLTNAPFHCGACGKPLAATDIRHRECFPTPSFLCGACGLPIGGNFIHPLCIAAETPSSREAD